MPGQTEAVVHSEQGTETAAVAPAGGSSVTVDPSFGPVGAKVKVEGASFDANAPVTVKFDGADAIIEPTKTGANGAFSTSLIVPAAASGNHTIQASDGVNTAFQRFTVTPAASIAPQSGHAGTKIAVSGSGFLAGGQASISFDNSSVLKAPIGTEGSFDAVFDAPARVAGTYNVKISDGTNTREFGFAVTTSVSMNPVTSQSAPGFVGQQVTVGGVGFVPGKALIVSYDGRQISSGTVSTDSNFSVTFAAPVSDAGQHTVAVTEGVNMIALKFFMDATAPPAPALATPKAGASEKPETTFEWAEASDPSGVTYNLEIATDPNFVAGSTVLEKAGIAATEYRLTHEEKLKPGKRGSAYFWRVRAQDRASNTGTWSNTNYFTVEAPAAAWVTWMFVGLGSLIVVLFAFWLGRRASAGRGAKGK